MVEPISGDEEEGLYNPYIRGGDIIVNDVAVSVHSEWFMDGLPFVKSASLPCIYEWLLYPVYVLFNVLGADSSDLLASSLGVHGNSGKDTPGVLFLVYILLLLPFITVGSSLALVKKALLYKKV